MLTAEELRRCRLIRQLKEEDRQASMKVLKVSKEMMSEAEEFLLAEISETELAREGKIIVPGEWPESADANAIWEWLLGSKLIPGHKWDGSTLVRCVESAMANGRLPRMQVATPAFRFLEYWGHDVNRSRLPGIVPPPYEVPLPTTPSHQRRVKQQLEVLKWLYNDGHDMRHYQVVRKFLKPLHEIIIELAKVVALRDQLKNATRDEKLDTTLRAGDLRRKGAR
ncbi:unnamed protein product [Sympodiomycopsis kandeliae]